MSGSQILRILTWLALALVPACDASPGGGSTLPRQGAPANPAAPADRGSADARARLPDPAGATPQTIGTFVEELARTLAEAPYEPPASRLPRAVRALDYDAYRSIRFRPDAALWRDAGSFQIHLFHPGFRFDTPVRIHVVTDEVRDVPFDPDFFVYEGNARPAGDELRAARESAGWRDPGYAGFRVHFPLNAPGRMDEVVAFQGASYFRLVGPHQVYGLSSRALAIDVATQREEEFPDFREFWLVRPKADATSLVIHALLDSPSLTGAYRLELRPGDAATELRVDARLFARRDVLKLGVAPMSSMFLYDPSLASAFDDFRTAVHDSDGLLMRTHSSEWIWRPLGNGRGLRVTSLRDVDPRGFGLVQRARDFEDYLDAEARYDLRPSEWVRVDPDDAWGPGGVELLEIPTESEFNDNIAAYWVPDAPVHAGEERRYRYTVTTFDSRLDQQSLAQVARTRMGAASLPGTADPAPPAHRRFVVDFQGGPLDELAADAAVQPVVETLAGRIEDVGVSALPEPGAWRVTFVVVPDGDRPADMRLWLRLGDDRLSETWSFVWYPDAAR